MAMICKIMVMSWQGHGNDVQKVRVCIFDSLDIDVSVGPSVFQNMMECNLTCSVQTVHFAF